MQTISILPAHEIQKIAAGEVVHRPANVVKELIENALDAGATHITLYIEKSGKNLIRVVDNGSGMSPEDATLCFHPHATSKLKTVDDLSRIHTFGFRGEALASISAISHATLITRHRDNSVGIRVHDTDTQETSCPIGCDISFTDLFYNTPARKKFLKQDETEWNHILSVFHGFCLTNTTVHFTLYRDGTRTLNIPSTDSLALRIGQLWGHNFAENMIDLSNSHTNIHGMISHHQFWRYNRSHIFFFVNNRHVKNYALSKSLINGYKNILPPQRYPAGFVFITLEGSDVDVNVHPRKEEVQFSRPGVIERMIKESVSKTLEDHLSQKFSQTPLTGEIKYHDIESQPFATEPSSSIPEHNTTDEHHHQSDNTRIQDASTPPLMKHHSSGTITPESRVNTCDQKDTPPHQGKDLNSSTHPTYEFSGTIIGQLLQTYILIEHNKQLLIVDQHAAHERILYEQFAAHFQQSIGTKLLFPELITLTPQATERVMAYQSIFTPLGLEIEHASDTSLAIKSAPPKIHRQSLTELIKEVHDFIEEHATLEEELLCTRLTEHTRGQMACKAAVKAGDTLSRHEMQHLVSTLLNTPNRFICVHGRPTMWSISQTELEKKFQRRT